MATWLAIRTTARKNAPGVPDYRGGEILAMVKGTLEDCPFRGRLERTGAVAVLCVNASLTETKARLGWTDPTPETAETAADPKFSRRVTRDKLRFALTGAQAQKVDAAFEPSIKSRASDLPRLSLDETALGLDTTAPAEKAPAKEGGGGVELLGVSMLAVASLFGGRGPAVLAWFVALAVAILMLVGLRMGAGDTITFTVGSDVGDDYSSWATAEAAIPADPVEHYTLTAARDEELSGGVTVNASNGNAVQILLTAVAGARRSATDPLRYGYGARITSSGRAASIQTAGVIVEWLALKCTAGGWETFTIFNASGIGRYLVIEAPAGVYGAQLYINDCLLHDSAILATAATSSYALSLSRIGGVGGATDARVWRCTVFSRSSTKNPVFVYAGSASANTMDARNVLAWSTTGIACYAVQAGAFPGEFAATADYLAGSDASAATYAATTSYASISDPFANSGAGVEDLHLAGEDTAAAIPGADLSGTIDEFDVEGQSRKYQAVGADDFPVAAGGRKWWSVGRYWMRRVRLGFHAQRMVR